MTTTVITGANKGLGKETARLLVGRGHRVYLGARDEGRGRAAAQEVGAQFVQLDVTDDASVASAFETIAAEGGLDVLVNNAGIAKRAGGATEAMDGPSVLESSTPTPWASSASPKPRCRCSSSPRILWW